MSDQQKAAAIDHLTNIFNQSIGCGLYKSYIDVAQTSGAIAYLSARTVDAEDFEKLRLDSALEASRLRDRIGELEEKLQSKE